MTPSHIDTLTRRFSAARRGTRKTLLRGALGSLLTVHGGRGAVADCKKVGQNCDTNGDCCNGARCRGGKCRCKSGRDECSGKCFNLDADENHCGACTTACSASERCCDGACVDLQTDRDHCAACGATCLAEEICLAGVCTPCPVGNEVCGDVCCPPFQACCDGVCVDELEFNPDHCGECGHRCPGICIIGPAGHLICTGPRCCDSGACIEEFDADPNNCGACQHACTGDASSCCDGECVDTDFDVRHCGSCGDACPAGERCRFGNCRD